MPPRSALLLALIAATAAADDATMQAWVASPDGSSALATVEQPQLGALHAAFEDLPSPCEMLVDVAASSVNPVDRTFPSISAPRVMGSDLCGVIRAHGENCSQRLPVGSRVWADIGANVVNGSTTTKENGAYANVAVALESQLGAAPASASTAICGALPKVALTSWKALVWYLNAKAWTGAETVVILGGSGGTGGAGIQLAKHFGAATVIATTSTKNVRYVEGLGADQVIDYRTTNWADVVPDGSVDAVYDTVGEAGTGDVALQKLKDSGSYVTIAGFSDVPADPRCSSFINSDTNLNNSYILDELAAIVDAGALSTTIDSTYSLEEVDAAFARSATGKVVGKVSVVVNATCGADFR